MELIKLIGAVLAPVILACGFYLLTEKTNFGKLKLLHRQIIIGIVYGILACLATQFGIPYEGYVLNVRSAAPLTAGLVFGGPAGLISGAIGALYRWFSIYWGIPTYTRVACSVATLLAGIISTVCNKYMFNGKKVSWFYGVIIAMATEVFHMLLVFITHMDDIQKAFTVVRDTAVTMIIANSVSLLITLLLISLLSKDKIIKTKYARPVTQTFSVFLFISVMVSFLITIGFTYTLQLGVSKMEVKNLLTKNISDVQSDIRVANDNDILRRTNEIKIAIESNEIFKSSYYIETQREALNGYLDTYNVSEINIIAKNGVIKISSDARFDGFDMNSDEVSKEFLCLFDGVESFVQDYRPRGYDETVLRKFAAVKLSDGTILQVGYNFELFSNTLKESLKDIAANRHIGQNGFLFIVSNDDGSLVSAPEGTVTDENIIEFAKVTDTADGEVLTFVSLEGEVYFYQKSQSEGYTIVGCIPETEAHFSLNIAVYIGAFMLLIVFFALFLVVFFLLKKIIVDNIHKVNDSLGKITAGDLSVQINIRDSEEFASLSEDINATVSRLKGFISDAEKRIDMELAFAKSIQHSVLPSVFPPYPDRKEFDIYATMHTAKEVGGDFYDFYMPDENHLVFLIADVSGKGIPAAMFMMNAKSVIKSLTESGLSAADAFTEANQRLCASNEAEMFVTAWMGILDITTGVVKFANAGHNPPLVRHADGRFEFYASRPGMVLAGLEGARYKENEFMLSHGDEIFLYTDGVTEATNTSIELFGDDRLKAALNAQPYSTAEDVCHAVKSCVDEFVGEAPQFDDITMLSLKYN